MNSEEQKAFEKCMKAIKRLLIEEKQCKQKLERIQKEKMNCIRVLLDDEYCEEIIGNDINVGSKGGKDEK